MRGGRLDLPTILAQFWWNEVKLEFGIDFFFSFARDRLLVFDCGQAVFVERETHLERALAQGHIVRLGSGEILHGRSERFRRQQAHVHLHAIAVPETDLILALGNDVHQAGEAEQVFDERLPRFRLNAALAGDEDVEVANGFASAAQRSGGRNLLYPRNRQQVLGQFLGPLFGGVEQESSPDAAIVFDRLEQLQFVFFAHARQRADLAFARQFLHALQIADLVGTPDQGNRLWSQPLNLEELKHRRTVFLQQLGVRFDTAIVEKHLQIGQHSFAYTLDCENLLRLVDQVGYLLRQRFNGLCRVAVGANTKRILTVDLQQIGSLVEKSGDSLVVHGWIDSREDSNAEEAGELAGAGGHNQRGRRGAHGSARKNRSAKPGVKRPPVR